MRFFALSLRLAGAAALLAAAPIAAAADPVRAPADASASNESGGAPQAVAPAADSKAKAERRICRFDGATGSNLRGKKICLTARQWRDRQAD